VRANSTSIARWIGAGLFLAAAAIGALQGLSGYEPFVPRSEDLGPAGFRALVRGLELMGRRVERASGSEAVEGALIVLEEYEGLRGDIEGGAWAFIAYEAEAWPEGLGEGKPFEPFAGEWPIEAMSFGKGAAIRPARPFAGAGNAELARADGARLLAAIEAALPEGSLLLRERTAASRAQGHPLGALALPGVLPIALCVAIASLLGAWRMATRFGRALPPPEDSRSGIPEHLAAVGRFIRLHASWDRIEALDASWYRLRAGSRRDRALAEAERGIDEERFRERRAAREKAVAAGSGEQRREQRRAQR